MENIILSIIWGDILSLVLICFGTVLLIMGLFVGILSVFKIFQKKESKKPEQPKVEIATAQEKNVKITDAEYAAIATALYLYFNNNNHDEEANVLTIENVQYNYSPWRNK